MLPWHAAQLASYAFFPAATDSGVDATGLGSDPDPALPLGSDLGLTPLSGAGDVVAVAPTTFLIMPSLFVRT
jgi:hypothetical protein